MTIRVSPPFPAPFPGMVLLELWGFRCKRCEHEWLPREKDRPPRVCPSCKSPYWDKPRRRSKVAEEAEQRQASESAASARQYLHATSPEIEAGNQYEGAFAASIRRLEQSLRLTEGRA